MVMNVGNNGNFSFKTPVDSKIDETIVYEVAAVRSIVETFISGVSPFETIYEPLGLAKEVFDEDFRNNITIITLKTFGGSELIYVPSSYIIKYPDTSGIKYVEKILAINLGKLPVDIDFSGLYDSIKEVILEQTNLTVEIAVVDNSAIEMVDEVDHIIYMNKINNLGNNALTYRELYHDLKIKYDEIWKITDEVNKNIKVTILDSTL